jgi:hypothetical protein
MPLTSDDCFAALDGNDGIANGSEDNGRLKGLGQEGTSTLSSSSLGGSDSVEESSSTRTGMAVKVVVFTAGDPSIGGTGTGGTMCGSPFSSSYVSGTVMFKFKIYKEYENKEDPVYDRLDCTHQRSRSIDGNCNID